MTTSEIKALVSLATSDDEANVELFKLYPLKDKLAALKYWWNVEIHQSQTQSGLEIHQSQTQGGLELQPYFSTNLHFAGCWVIFWAERYAFCGDSSVWIQFICYYNEERYEDNFWIEEVKRIKNGLVEMRSFISRNI
jgi:hypothetical protein